MKRWLKTITLSLALVICLATVFSAGVAVGRSNPSLGTGVAYAAEEPAEFELFRQAWDIVQGHFVDREALEPTRLIYAAINGMVEALGDEGHTRFLTAQEAAQQQRSLSGSFSGIGARLGIEDGLPVIAMPFEGSPAEEAGIRAGDVILEVDGVSVTNWSLAEITQRVRGEAGTQVTLTVFRPDTGEQLQFTIVRDEISLPAASWALVAGTDVALIRLNQFSSNLNDELVAAISDARKAGATRLVLDVRDNPGGLLVQAIETTSQFLQEGDVVLEEDSAGNREAYRVQQGGIATDMPLIVLTNRGTASAAEIFAGAIQDQGRGLVVGEVTFGTGTVLQPFDLSDGSVILLGTHQWLTPNGRLIRNRGLTPDVVVELPAGAQIITPDELRQLPFSKIFDSDDAQLLKALELMGVLPWTPLGLARAEN